MTDSILIVGGGVAGLSAAVECAAAGARAIVVEHDAIVGGRLAASMTQTGAVGDSDGGTPMPRLASLATNRNIEILTLAEVETLQGRPGNFDVAIRERARFVTDACTRCNHCRPVCPVVLPNEHDAGLSYRKAIFTPLPETLPQEFVIDIDACLNTPPNYLPCNRCTEVCDDDAIHFDLPLARTHGRQIGAVIIAAGLELVKPAGAGAQFYGDHPDIVTTAEMERLLTAPGPTGGFAAKPSNEEYPDSVLLILDDLTPFSVATAVSQIDRLVGQSISEVALLILTQTGDGERASLMQQLPGGVRVDAGLLQKLEAAEHNRIAVGYASFSDSRVPEKHYDMVVLGADVGPAAGLGELANVIGFDLADTGYAAIPSPSEPLATSCPGVYVAGGARGPLTHHEAITQGKAAASAALAHLDPRLLTDGYASAAQGEAHADAVRLSQEEYRARMEHVLFALLGNKD